MFNYRKNEYFKNRTKELETENKYLKDKISKLENKTYNNDDLIEQVKLKLQELKKKTFKTYRYVILVDENYRVELWNNGNLETYIKRIQFDTKENDFNSFPELIITK